jgi:hypothetical protein
MYILGSRKMKKVYYTIGEIKITADSHHPMSMPISRSEVENAADSHNPMCMTISRSWAEISSACILMQVKTSWSMHPMTYH